MRKIILTSATFCLILAYTATQQTAHSSSDNPPSGRTGQNGSSCANGGCHTSGAAGLETIGTDLLLEFFDSNGQAVTSYTPGEQYTVSVEFLSNFSTYGFALSRDGNSGQFIAGAGSNYASNGSVPQMEHSGVNTTGQWQFDWVAPTTDEGAITFYMGALGGNGSYSTSGDTGYEGTVTLNANPVTSSPPFEAKLLLEGPYLSNGLMSNSLQNQGLLPSTQPFSAPPWSYAGTESINNNNVAITDWILLDFYASTDLTTPALRMAALLSTNGLVLDVDGNAGINIDELPTNVDYRVIARTRNHLDIMSASDLSFPLTGAYDFSNPTLVAGTNQLKPLANGYFACKAGDFNGDGACTFLDYNWSLSEASAINNYVQYDSDLDGHGTVRDYNLYKANFNAIGVPEVRY